ncbi:cytochrome P450 CYP82H23-like [Vitis vinifera]|uniref:cytochrome P450 CYP82H23-like n=1 Tax=Vitis vinifera TaxID=29760 RepID=UPI0028830403|nr:cytochrome P450 CYP82H23-like [Vitis vinifera]
MALIGHLHLVRAGKPQHQAFGAMADKYGPIFCFHIGLRKLMGYGHAMFGFSPCGPYWRDVRKLASVELLSNRQLELLNHVRDSEVKLFIKELYGQWIQNGDRPVLVEMKEKCWHLAANVMVSAVAGKFWHRYK